MKINKAEIIELRRQGLSVNKIAAALGISKSSVGPIAKAVVLTDEQKYALKYRSPDALNTYRNKVKAGEIAWPRRARKPKQYYVKLNSEYNIKRYFKRMMWMKNILGGRCQTCHDDDILRLEIDHIDRTQKLFNLSARWSAPKSVLLNELAKCQLLCNSCHASKTALESMATEHGRWATYQKRGCRCNLCVDFMRSYFRNRRKTTPKSPPKLEKITCIVCSQVAAIPYKPPSYRTSHGGPYCSKRCGGAYGASIKYKNRPIIHGISRYKRGCRCDVCRLARRSKSKVERKRY